MCRKCTLQFIKSTVSVSETVQKNQLVPKWNILKIIQQLHFLQQLNPTIWDFRIVQKSVIREYRIT